MTQPPLLVAFELSLACHVALLGAVTVRFGRQMNVTRAEALKIIYDTQAAEQELTQLRQQLSELGHGSPGGSQYVQAPWAPRIRIPERAPMALSGASRTEISQNHEGQLPLTKALM